MKMLETGDYRLVKETIGLQDYWAIYFIYHGYNGRSYSFMAYRETLSEALTYCREVKI